MNKKMKYKIIFVSMRLICNFFVSGLIILLVFSCKNGKVSDMPKMETDVDSLSYYLGVYTGLTLRDLDYKKFDKDVFDSAVNKVFNHKELDLADYSRADSIINVFVEKLRKNQNEKIIKDGKEFLEVNKKRKNIITTASGLQYEIIREGKGLQPTINDSVFIQFQGKLLSGKVFANSIEGGQQNRFVIKGFWLKGWVEGIPLMHEGSKYIFYMSPELAYGENPMPTPNSVLKPDMTVILDVELISVYPKTLK